MIARPLYTMSSEEVANVEVEGVRLFVGNLPFKTTNEDLIELFNEFGEVKLARLAIRNRRALGYGFVTMADQAAADAAVAKLQNMEYHERPLNVELAKQDSAPRNTEENGERRRPRRPRQRRAEKEDGASSDDDAAKRATQPRRRNFGGEGEEHDEEHKPRPRRQRNSRPRENGDANGTGERPKRTPEEREERMQRIREMQKERATKRADLPDSDTQVFVSNIPYSYGEEEIIAAFDNLQITKVRVVTTSLGRSRGFCFVDLANKSEQLKALEEIPKKQLEGRDVSVRVSKVEPEKEEAL